MPKPPLTIWCNADFTPADLQLLKEGCGHHRLLLSTTKQKSNLVAGGPDPLLAEADIAFGQPAPEQVVADQKIKWVHLTSAGYTRYDTADFRAGLRARHAAMTTSSTVFAEPCAEHAMAMMMAFARQLPQCLDVQHRNRGWPQATIRADSRLLNGQTVLLYGYGSIAARMVEYLSPFKMNLIGVRRKPRGDEPIRTVSIADADALLVSADHVVNILPESDETLQYFHAARLACIRPNACFYNIGRGSTVDQYALWTALETRHLCAAYLDVMTPEPLPADSPLWSSPHCYITPHTAGGHHNEFERLVRHFLENLRRYTHGLPLADHVI